MVVYLLIISEKAWQDDRLNLVFLKAQNTASRKKRYLLELQYDMWLRKAAARHKSLIARRQNI
jgi:hypothetical protein